MSFRIASRFLVQTLFCAAGAFGLQFAAGAYRAEFAGYADEPAHVVTGVMLDQYARDYPSWRYPLQYVENYYAHYPKVAIGHWPPLLYVVQALGTVLFGPSRTVILLVQALLAGILGSVLFRLLSTTLGFLPAAIGTFAFLATRLIQTHTSMVMAEILLTLTVFLACLAFSRFAQTQSWRDAVMFGLWTSAAILTKGTGWLLVMAPPLTIALTRRWKLLKSPALWCSVLIVMALCLPWQIATARLAAVGWESPSPNLAYSSRAALKLTKLMFTIPGAPLTILALAGSVYQFGRKWRKREIPALTASLVSLAFAAWLFHVIVPAGVEPRKLVVAVPPLFVLAGLGANSIARLIFPPQRVGLATGAIFSCACLITILSSFPLTRKPQYGYIEAARVLAQRMPTNTAVLVSSDSIGEGALISELALLDPKPRAYVIRGSKFLSSSDWAGGNYKLLASSEEDCKRLLDSVPISFIVLDLRLNIEEADHRLLKTFLNDRASEWILVGQFAPEGRTDSTVALYHSSQGARSVQHLIRPSPQLR